jgi:hypothetical protein
MLQRSHISHAPHPDAEDLNRDTMIKISLHYGTDPPIALYIWRHHDNHAMVEARPIDRRRESQEPILVATDLQPLDKRRDTNPPIE